jgi:hypothetical protein
MDAALHHSNWNITGFADHELSGVSYRGGTREGRDLRVGNADGFGEFVAECAKAGAENEANFRAEFRLREYECRGGFSASV